MLLCQTNFTDFVRIGCHPRFEQLLGVPLSSREAPIRIIIKAIRNGCQESPALLDTDTCQG
jgi:hypothetical protein